METVDQGKFSCNQCGKTYKWKPDFAGRKVKCKCGYVMTAPKDPPGAPKPAESDEPDLDALYSLADEGKQAAKAGAVETAIRCPSCKQEMEPGATICGSCGFNLKTGSKAKPAAAAKPGVTRAPGAPVPAGAGAPGGGAFVAYGTPRKGLQQDAPRDFRALDLYLPIGLLVGGTALSVIQFMKFDQNLEPLPQALMFTGMRLVISFAIVAVMSIFLIKWMEMAFGDPALAALKIAAACLAPAAIASIIGYMVNDAWGLVRYFLALAMIFTIYHYLFEWDQGEKWVISVITAAVVIFGAPFIVEQIKGQAPGALASKAVHNDDAQIDYMIDELGMPKNARQWIDDSGGRLVGDNARPDSVALIDGLYNLGAVKVWIATEPKNPKAAEIYVEMPKDKKKRKAIIDFFSTWNTGHQRNAITDNGGKYLIQTFLPFMRPEKIGF
jgi:hypothetical protein